MKLCANTAQRNDVENVRWWLVDAVSSIVRIGHALPWLASCHAVPETATTNVVTRAAIN